MKEKQNVLRPFYKEVARIPLLTPEEEIALFKKYKEYDDENARKKIIEANLRLVISIANEFRGSKVPLEDLIQEGILGLMKAVEKFDIKRGCKFSSYAHFWIRAMIQRAACEDLVVHLPANITDDIKRLEKIERIEKATIGTVRELTLEKGLSLGIKIKRLKRIEYAREIKIIQDQNEDKDGKEWSIIENLSADEISPLDAVLQAEFVWFKKAKTVLTEQEQKILELRIQYEKTLCEIGKKFGLSRERIRQIEKSAIKKLRALAEGRELTSRRGRRKKEVNAAV
jgi:RNA polymerase primary sigma factor